MTYLKKLNGSNVFSLTPHKVTIKKRLNNFYILEKDYEILKFNI